MKNDAYLTGLEKGRRDHLAGEIAMLAAKLSSLRYEYAKIGKRAYDRARWDKANV